LTSTTVLDVQDLEKPEQWKYQNLMSWEGTPSIEDLQDPKARVNHVRKLAASYADPWRTAGTMIRDDTVLPIDKGLYWMPIDWDNRNGRVTIAGDAAHSMLPRK
jgi:2-polyprenyl-6-methoxyphenol hydroxylase-like FAD-dependent oxidoreductase